MCNSVMQSQKTFVSTFATTRVRSRYDLQATSNTLLSVAKEVTCKKCFFFIVFLLCSSFSPPPSSSSSYTKIEQIGTI